MVVFIWVKYTCLPAGLSIGWRQRGINSVPPDAFKEFFNLAGQWYIKSQ